MKQGVLAFSLDFELHWGVFDGCGDEYNQNLIRGRKAVPKILEQFEQNEIHGTWACVGFLFTKTREEIDNIQPDRNLRPTYKNEELSPYRIKIGANEETDLLHYAPSLIKLIKATHGQEVSTHTFSHYYCLEAGQTEVQFEEDIKAAIRAAEKENVNIDSIVFPRNQVNKEYLSILNKYGIKIYRGTADSKIYESDNFKTFNRFHYKLLRIADTYLNLTGPNTYCINTLSKTREVLNIPASRLLRPYSEHLSFLEPFKLKRIKKSMLHAAQQKKIYHLWWHPHNFGKNLKENIQNLSDILSYYKFLSDKYGMISANMRELGKLYQQEKTND